MIGEMLERAQLGTFEIKQMYRLFTSHFAHVSETRFRDDLADKDWIIRIRDSKGLVGFTSLKQIRVSTHTADMNLLYSGDTIVMPHARSSMSLARTWVQSVQKITAQSESSELHWFLLVSGFRTYRLLPVFWMEFFPNYVVPTPAHVRNTMDSVAVQLFGTAYDRTRGIVRFKEPQPLRSELAGIPVGRLSDPHVRFFASANSGHANGDELVCWTRIAENNLTAAGARIWHAPRHERASATLA